MQNFFGKVKMLISSSSACSDKKALEQLNIIVMPLSEVDSDYPRRVLNYILTGNDALILQELRNLTDDKAGCLTGFPGTYSYYWGSRWYHNFSTKVERLITQSINAREKLYHRIFTALTAEQIIRYSRFLVAVTRKDNFTQLTAISPDWFTYLVVDGLITTINNQESSSFSNRDSWSLQCLESILQADSTQPESAYKIIINLMFERKEVDEYNTDNLNNIYTLADTIDYLQQHQDYLQELIPSLSAKGQQQFIKYFADLYPDFIKQMPALVVQLSISNSKTVRQTAQSKLSLFERTALLPCFQNLLQNGNAKQRRMAADLIAIEAAREDGEQHISSDSHLQLLQDALAIETQKSVAAAIQSALSRLDSVDTIEDESFSIEPVKPITAQKIPESFVEVLNRNLDEIIEKQRVLAEQEKDENKMGLHSYNWQQENYKDWKKITSKNYPKNIVSTLNANTGKQGILRNRFAVQLCTHKNSLKHLPEFGLHHAIRLVQDDSHINWYRLDDYLTPDLLHNIELRQLAEVFIDCGIKNANRLIAERYLLDYEASNLTQLVSSPEQVAPFFIENIDFISEALGLIPSEGYNQWQVFQPSRGIKILATFPYIPKLFVPKLLELALGENKGLRQEAQDLLSDLPDIHKRAIEALEDGKQVIRVTAVEWLVRLNNHDNSHQQEILNALHNLLKKEKKEIVIASLLTALEQMGEDISAYLSPDALLKDAQKGLKGKTLKSFEWFDLDSLPEAYWKNGDLVAPTIIQWWVTLAEKLKDPMPNGLLQRYMSLLDKNSQQALSLHLLQHFITEDTPSPTLDEAMAIAKADAPGRLQIYQDYYNEFGYKDPDSWAYSYGSLTLNDVIEQIKKERLAVYLGSAIKSKGLLALTFAAEGSRAVSILQDFMKHHYQRTAQVIAMLTALSASNDPLVIQFLLGLSRRYRTRSVQEHAKELVTQIAQRNNWNADELADRTIPTVGLDDKGILTLDYGTRTLTAFVNDNDKFVLQNETGKTLKSLPAPRQNDDKSIIKEAKSQFSNSKKELKQVLSLQNSRLYEAMCSERLWHSQDWQTYLFAHPIMKRLVTRLVWLEMTEDGKEVITAFRPSDDGALLDVEDEEIHLGERSQIKLAHAVLMSDETVQHWRQHLQDYEIKPLFNQFDHTCPSFDKHADKIDEFKGYMTDTYTLRGVLTKMGYQRASIEDASSFDRYFKHYDSLGMSAVIVFSGSYVPEENIPAVLFELCFEHKHSYTWNTNYDVKPILLAESYAEYKRVAESTAGYDAEWEKKTPW